MTSSRATAIAGSAVVTLAFCRLRIVPGRLEPPRDCGTMTLGDLVRTAGVEPARVSSRNFKSLASMLATSTCAARSGLGHFRPRCQCVMAAMEWKRTSHAWPKAWSKRWSDWAILLSRSARPAAHRAPAPPGIRRLPAGPACPFAGWIRCRPALGSNPAAVTNTRAGGSNAAQVLAKLSGVTNQIGWAAPPPGATKTGCMPDDPRMNGMLLSRPLAGVKLLPKRGKPPVEGRFAG